MIDRERHPSLLACIADGTARDRPRPSAGPTLDLARTFPNQAEVGIEGTHYVQEQSPTAIGEATAAWWPGTALGRHDVPASHSSSQSASVSAGGSAPVTSNETIEGFRIEIREPNEVSAEDRRLIAAIFDAAYSRANQPYLDASIERIGRIAFAVGEDGAPAAYAIGRPRWMALAGFREPQLVWLHGMRATDPSYRHRGLSGALSRALSVAARGEIGEPPARELGCGRFGHASRQGQMVEGNHVPWPGIVPTLWQQAVGLAVAEAYGSDLDPETFVCRGSGTPIGVPNVDFAATEHERQVYAPVQRERGDNLLVINWTPDPPPRWADPDRPLEELV